MEDLRDMARNVIERLSPTQKSFVSAGTNIGVVVRPASTRRSLIRKGLATGRGHAGLFADSCLDWTMLGREVRRILRKEVGLPE